MARYGVSLELTVAIMASVALHAVWLVREAKAAHAPPVTPAEIILEADTVPTPPPPPPEPTPAAAQEQPTDRASPAAAPQPASARQAALLPAAAQAGKTLTAPEDDTAAVADFTLVQGSGQSYAGGTTSALGTASTAVHGAASDHPLATPERAARNAPVASVPTGPDRSRGATPAVANWNCSRLFPDDPEAGDQATVVIAVTVLPNGTPKAVTVLRDAGHGFGAAARACAMGQRFNAAYDRQGTPVLATTPPITVRFTR